MSRYVARRRVELGLLRQEVSIPQTHLAGAEAEVDFGEFSATIADHAVEIGPRVRYEVTAVSRPETPGSASATPSRVKW